MNTGNNSSDACPTPKPTGAGALGIRPCAILVLDDDLVSQRIITGALQSEAGFRLLAARSVSEAQLYLADNKIDLFILDVNLPDGNGLDFLCDVLTTDPTASALVVTGAPLPHTRKQAESLGALAFVEKPISKSQLLEFVRKKIATRAADAAQATETSHFHKDAFTGSLSGLSVLDIVQLKCLSGSCRTLEFSSGDRKGRIYFEKGRIVHAEAEGLAGMPALSKILLWVGGKVTERADLPPPEKTLSADWQVLLLEAIHNGETAAAAA